MEKSAVATASLGDGLGPYPHILIPEFKDLENTETLPADRPTLCRHADARVRSLALLARGSQAAGLRRTVVVVRVRGCVSCRHCQGPGQDQNLQHGNRSQGLILIKALAAPQPSSGSPSFTPISGIPSLANVCRRSHISRMHALEHQAGLENEPPRSISWQMQDT